MNNIKDKRIKKQIQKRTKLYNTKKEEKNMEISSTKLKEIRMNAQSDIIDDDMLTPRAFDRTKKSMGAKGFVMNISENNESKNEDLKKDEIINNNLNNKMLKNNQSNENNGFNNNNDNNNDNNNNNNNNNRYNGILNNDERHNYEYNHNKNMMSPNKRNIPDCNNSTTDNSRYINCDNDNYNYSMKQNVSSFMNAGWQTPKKSNVGSYYTGIDHPSTLKKYKTPCEKDMLEPDESLIGNKCITINNYVNPPKYINNLVTPSKFPLSGENDDFMSYEDFKGLFKHNSCLISEYEYNNDKSSTSLLDNCSKQYLEELNDNNQNNAWPKKKDNYSSPQKSNTILQCSNNIISSNNNNNNNNNNNYGNFNNNKDSPRSKKKRFDAHKNISTRKILNIVVSNGKRKEDHNEDSYNNSIHNNIMKKRKVNSSSEKSDPCDLDSIDYEVNPVLKTDIKKDKNNNLEIKNDVAKNTNVEIDNSAEKNKEGEKNKHVQININNNKIALNDDESNNKSVNEMIKEKHNPLKIKYEGYSSDLNVIFNKETGTPYQLIAMYRNLLVVISRRNQKNEPVFFQIVKPEVRVLNNSISFTQELIKQLAWIAPNLIQLNKVTITKEVFESNQRYYPEFVTGKKIEDIQIREHTDNCDNLYKYSNEEKLEMLKRIIINWVNKKHNEFLENLNPNFYLAKYSQLKKWHSNFNYEEIVFPSVTLEENKVLAHLARTPQESNADDFIVIQDSPIKCATNDLRKNGTFLQDMEKEKTRTPLGKNRRRGSTYLGAIGAYNNSNNNNNQTEDSPSKKKETKNMKNIREEANKKKIIKEIKMEIDKEFDELLDQKKKLENALWIAEIIHDSFIVQGTHTVIEIQTFAKKLSDKYKSNKDFLMDQNYIAQIIELLPQYINDIHIKPGMMNKNKKNLSVKSKKNLYNFLEPLSNEINTLNKKYQELKNNKENKLIDLWKNYNVQYELTENIKKYFSNPGSVSLADI
ncbi:hypothetical protein PFNF135_04872 [Plasmodium falciparum NF135/5.C10]|uniref:CDT1 Geminin-binding domain-containing protein n=1 Tax=Plasmodium falciparum NF135/5.C10 TaxID=1036726 RepID=W4IA52_PLAFA|nr:hypothetical protein PFNF135_04872 [Plasmodium falciparum NF135/5.C10]